MKLGDHRPDEAPCAIFPRRLSLGCWDRSGHGGESCRAWLARICNDARLEKRRLLEQALKEAGVRNDVEMQQLDVSSEGSDWIQKEGKAS